LAVCFRSWVCFLIREVGRGRVRVGSPKNTLCRGVFRIFGHSTTVLRQLLLLGLVSGDFPLPLGAPPCFERDEPPLSGERLCQVQNCFSAALDGAGTRSVDVASGDRGVRPAGLEPV